MKQTLIAPVHDPRHFTQKQSPAALENAFHEVTRNLSHELVMRITSGQISNREMESSPKLKRAIDLQSAISAKKVP